MRPIVLTIASILLAPGVGAVIVPEPSHGLVDGSALAAAAFRARMRRRGAAGTSRE
jgi:hypothetical protein